MTDSTFLLWAFSFVPTIIVVCAGLADHRRSLLSPFWPMVFPVFVGTSLKIGMAAFSGDARVTQNFEGLDNNDIFLSLILISLFFLIAAFTYFLVPSGVADRLDHVRSSMTSIRLNSGVMLLITVIVLSSSIYSLYLLLKVSGSNFGSLADFTGKRSVLEETGVVSSGGIYRFFLNLTHVNTTLLIAIFYCCRASRRDPLLWAGMILGILVTFICCVGVSSRSSFVLVLIPAVGILKMEKFISWTQFTLLVVGALIFANSIVILRPRTNSQESLSLVEIVKRSNELPVGLTAVTNGTDVTKITRIRKHLDRNSEYYYGKSLIVWPILMVPRAFFPNKPDVQLSGYISRNVYGGKPGVDIGSIPPSLVGEGYLNGGWIGAFFGAIIYGAALKFISSRLFPNRGSGLFKVFLFLSALPLFSYFINMGDFGSSMVRLCLDLISGFILLQIYQQTALSTAPVTGLEELEEELEEGLDEPDSEI